MSPQIRSSNLRIKKQFSDSDRDAFLDDTFEYLARFFEGSLQELQDRNPGITTRFKRVDTTRFTATIYNQGQMTAQCGIRVGGMLGAGISYSSDPNATNSFNESMSVVDDGHAMSLRAMGMAMMGSAKENLTQQGAAEYFWDILIRPLQQ